MRLKNATLFALIALILLTVLQLADFIVSLVNFGRGSIAALELFTSAIHFLASLSVTVFLYVYYKSRA